MEAQTGSKPLVIYDPPTKHQIIQNEAGKNVCYSVSITCSPAKNYPCRIYIMDCLDANRKEAKAMWYAELRNQGEKNRWNGNRG